MFFLLVVFIGSVGAALEDVSGQCRLDPHPSVEYRCLAPGAGAEDSHPCSSFEPAGTLVNPRCRTPNYYSTSPLPFMRCFDGYWDYIARCTPECGRVTPGGTGLVVGGQGARRGELPWHAGVYTTATKPYMQICGGSLVSTNVILSAAHCFWNDLEKQLPASRFAVAVGKLYRRWSDPRDDAQNSTVKIIHLPTRFQGSGANFQDDIAVVVTARAFLYRTHVRPVCLSFDYHFEQQQLFSGNMGKVAGWGLTDADGPPSPALQVLSMPYVEAGTCIQHAPPDFREYITSDKICAGTLDSSSALCKGDSGGGIAFSESIRGAERFFLRGVVSTAPSSEHACNTVTYTGFTLLSKHEQFIKQFWIESGEFRCQDGSFVSAAAHCDGARDCADSSDETPRACSRKPCSAYLFRCQYGACVDRGAACNQVADCVDGSDEDEELCGGSKSESQICGGLDSANVSITGKVTFDSANVSITGYEWDGDTRRCYKFHSEAVNWTAANASCTAEGAALALGASPAREALLRRLFKRHPPASLPGVIYRNYLAAGAKRDDAGVWRTLDGAPLSSRVAAGHQPWYAGFPTAEADSVFAYMERDGKLENYPISTILVPYVCERPPRT